MKFALNFCVMEIEERDSTIIKDDVISFTSIAF